MKAYLYCDKRSLNEATKYYIDIVHSCLSDEGYEFEVVHNLSDIKSPDIIFTITCKYYLNAEIRYPFVKTIFWSQGVSAEEAKMADHSVKGRFRYYFRLFAESIAINKSNVILFVSTRMKQFFMKRYGYKDPGNSVVMPCYNLKLSSEFNLSQYDKPTFAYAGGASVWQGVDLMLNVYKLIEDSIPESRLIICTADKESFQNKIAQLGIKNYEIKFVPIEFLQEELHKYKYGFILRNNHIVNQVATPTKMNSYLANYMIPIYSESVQDFKDNLDLKEFAIMASMPLDAKQIANQIIEFENRHIDYSKYKKVVMEIFEKHYNDSKYKNLIKTKIIEFLH